jgi:phage I-like protein
VITADTKPEPTLRAQFSTAYARGAKWNLLMPRGTYHGANLAPIGGSITIDDALLSELVANWKAAGSPPLPVRKTHRHLDDDVPAVDRPELEKAFGFLTDMRVTAAGLEVLTDWNPAGKATVDAREFAFWSPEWQPRHRDRRTGEMKGWWLSGTALTNDPFFNEMPPVAAATTPPTDPPAVKETPMNEQQKQLRARLGLAETATDAEVLAAQTKRDEDLTTLKANAEKAPVLTAADVKAAVDASVAPLKAQMAATEEKLKAAETKALELEVDALIATAKAGDG